MDLVFVVVAFVLIFLLIVCYNLNIIKKTNDLPTLFKTIKKTIPSMQGFSLGRQDRPDKYTNVNIDADENIKVTHDDFPISLDAKFTILKEHGTVKYSENGFTISGIDLVKFTCPPGYEGGECTPMPLCTPEDAGKTKPLSHTHFNVLKLYRNEFSHNQILRFTDQAFHPRLRINCQNKDGDYVIESCPQNTLLDNDLKCQPYDICNDRLNGYKHTYTVNANDPALDKSEYYLCQNNSSVKRTCENGTIFNEATHGCQSVCFDRGNETIAIDDKKYVQCTNDYATEIHCTTRVVKSNGVHSCFVPTCKPQRVTFTNSRLLYDYGEITCVDDRPVKRLCNTEYADKVFNYTWVTPFKVTLYHWPKEIMQNGECVAPTNDIIANPFINLKWSVAMPEAHKFNLKTQEYVCDKGTTHRWDYIQQHLVPRLPPKSYDKYVYSGAPCQNVRPQILRYQINSYPKDKIYIIRSQPALLASYTNIHLWPVHNKSANLYYVTHLTYNDVGLKIATYSSKILPMGFSLSTNAKYDDDGYAKCTLIGYPNFRANANEQYYFIYSTNNSLQLAQLYNPLMTYERVREYLKDPNIKYNTNSIYAINLDMKLRKFQVPSSSDVPREFKTEYDLDAQTYTHLKTNNTYKLGFIEHQYRINS